jgi:hypothetical protein
MMKGSIVLTMVEGSKALEGSMVVVRCGLLLGAL